MRFGLLCQNAPSFKRLLVFFQVNQLVGGKQKVGPSECVNYPIFLGVGNKFQQGWGGGHFFCLCGLARCLVLSRLGFSFEEHLDKGFYEPALKVLNKTGGR